MSSSGGVELHFKPHLSYHGFWDEMLGISMFWTEKFLILLLYLQRLAVILLWNLKWPVLFNTRTDFMFVVLLDFTAHHDNVAALGNGSIFEGCETICKLVWPLAGVFTVGTWAAIHLLDTTTTYYTRNLERVFWTLTRLFIVPFFNVLIRYYILNQNGNLDVLTSTWFTPISEIGVGLLLLTLAAFLGIGYIRSSAQILFDSQIRHEAYIRSRELEYLLKFSTAYRNDRIWMISNYTYLAWPWSLIRGVLDVVFLLIINVVPVEYGSIIGTVLLFLVAAVSTFFVRVYRVASSNAIDFILNWTLVIFLVFGVLQVYGVRNALLVDNNLDYFLFGLHGGAVALVLLLSLYFFIDGHNFGNLSIAEQRARRKWRKVFLGIDDEAESKKGCWSFLTGDANDEWVQFKTGSMDEANDDDDDDDKKAMEQERFVQQMRKDQADRAAASPDRFYIPKTSGVVSINTASTHVWPVNNIIVNELLRRNTVDHLVDVLRAARKMLDRISALHNTPVLIPTDELKTHINRLKACLVHVQRERVTHHCGVIHPLQTTFEDLIDQFTYELRVFSGSSVTVGHNARKMIEVSRYLRVRMQKRDRTLALISPTMRRILMKLFALRIFIQLVNDRPTFLLPQTENGFGGANDADIQDSDDEDGKGAGSPRQPQNYVAFEDQDQDAIGAFIAGEGNGDEGLEGGGALDAAEADNDDAAALANLLAKKHK